MNYDMKISRAYIEFQKQQPVKPDANSKPGSS